MHLYHLLRVAYPGFQSNTVRRRKIKTVRKMDASNFSRPDPQMRHISGTAGSSG